MNLHVTGHHLDVTPAMRAYLTSKLERVMRHFDHLMDVSVILSTEREQRKVEANVRLSGKSLFAESRDVDMYAAIDALVDKLDRQILKHKEKRADPRGDMSLKRAPEEE
jgi:putative sigma-54 modulation protein